MSYSDTAYRRGVNHAKAEIKLGNEKPSDEPLDISDAEQLHWELTGFKTSERGIDFLEVIVDAYETGYFETWEDHNDDATG